MLALRIQFADFNVWMFVFVAATALVLFAAPKLTERLIRRLGATRVSKPEVKFLFLVLFFLGELASTAKSEVVLPAYLLGLALAGVFLRDKTLVLRMRSIAFAIFTPFFFIKAGLYVSLPALWAAITSVAALLALKLITICLGMLRELLEWGALLKLASQPPAKLLIRDGLLRSVLLTERAFRALRKRFEELTQRHGLMLAGVVKRSNVINYLTVALGLNESFAGGSHHICSCRKLWNARPRRSSIAGLATARWGNPTWRGWTMATACRCFRWMLPPGRSNALRK